MSDFPHVNRRAIDRLDREIVEFLDGLRAAVHLHVVLKSAKFCSARRENQVLRADGVDDVNGRKPLSLERRWIDIHADDALLATVGEGRGSTRHGRQLRADKVVAEIEKLLFAESTAGQADLDDRHGRRRIDDYQRRRGSRREESQEGLRDGGSLGQCRLNVGARLKEDLDDGDARQGLRFDVLDVAHQRGDPAFDVGGDALLHLLRLQAIVGPHETDDWNVDVGKNVHRRA